MEIVTGDFGVEVTNSLKLGQMQTVATRLTLVEAIQAGLTGKPGPPSPQFKETGGPLTKLLKCLGPLAIEKAKSTDTKLYLEKIFQPDVKPTEITALEPILLLLSFLNRKPIFFVASPDSDFPGHIGWHKPPGSERPVRIKEGKGDIGETIKGLGRPKDHAIVVTEQDGLCSAWISTARYNYIVQNPDHQSNTKLWKAIETKAIGTRTVPHVLQLKNQDPPKNTTKAKTLANSNIAECPPPPSCNKRPNPNDTTAEGTTGGHSSSSSIGTKQATRSQTPTRAGVKCTKQKPAPKRKKGKTTTTAGEPATDTSTATDSAVQVSGSESD